VLTTILLAACLFPSVQSEDGELERWQAHYSRVAEELADRPVEGLSGAVRARRAEMVAELRRYCAAADFGRGADPAQRLPLFVDADGRHCAVAHLLRYCGETELVARVAGADNGAWVGDLAGDARFGAWLDAVGLTLEEAARIQAPALPPGGWEFSDGLPHDVFYRTSPPPAEPRDEGGESAGDGASATADRPAAPVPAAPAAGPPTVAGKGSSSAVSFAGGDVADWTVWWQFNKLAWLRPRPLDLAPATGDALGENESALDSARRRARPLVERELASPSAAVRAAAAVAYARAAGAEALPELERLLDDPSRDVRMAALFAFAATGTEEGVHALLEVVAREDEPGADLRAAAIVALGAARAEGHGAGVAGMLPSLLAERGDDDEAFALFTLPALGAGDELLGQAKERSGVFERRGRSSEAPAVRARATEALAQAPAGEVLSPLLDAAGGRDAEVRRAAALALGEVDGALAPLMTACELEREPLARAFALLSIGRHGGEAARGFLEHELEHGSAEARPWCALALGLLAEDSSDPAACAALRAGYAAEESRTARGAYLLALGIAGDVDAQQLMVKALAAKDAPTRAYAAQGLGILRLPGCRAALRAALPAESTPLVRSAMAQALALQGDPRDAELLLGELAAVRDPLVRGQLAAALGFHGSPEALDGLLAALGSQDLAGQGRAAALGALAVTLSGRDRLTLGAASAGADYVVFPGWFLEVLQQPL
jgi:HEAT repeat protein